MKAIFITGTDTGVGKTVVTGLLAGYFLKKGYRVVTQKWAQTGNGKDIRIHIKIMRGKQGDYTTLGSLMSPYVLQHASSPHLAARLEGKRIDLSRVEKSFIVLSKMFDIVIVEGTGGVFVPLGEQTLLIDFVKRLRLPVLVVAGNKLGCVNHTLLTIEAMKSRRIKILGIVFNNMAKNEDTVILRDNPRIVKKFIKDDILGVLPFDRKVPNLYRYFMPIGEKISSKL